MRIAFAGTPEFAQRALSAILLAGYDVVMVLTQPDRPAGRGRKLQMSPVKLLALEHGLPVYQPERLKDPATHEPLRSAMADFLVVAAYGLILPQAVLDIPTRGCINIHASLLPRWRGAAPIQRAIEAGDDETGVTLMAMEAGLDTGPMLMNASVPISHADTAGSLHDKLADLGAELIVRALSQPDRLVPVPQPELGVTYAKKIDKTEAELNFCRPAVELARQTRAFDPFPGLTATIDDTAIKIWRAEAVAGSGSPGSILKVDADGILVACGHGALRVVELQKPGGRRLSASDFLHGFPLRAESRFRLA